MFVDEKELQIKAGKGGDGVALFRREIYVPRGGPDGGDGGKGGSIYVQAQDNLHTLSHLAHVDRIEAEEGKKGGHKRSTGKSGEDTVIAVPLGTIVEEKTEKDWELVVELTHPAEQVQIAKGGNGGWGNWHFRSSIQQAPERWNPGQPGEEKRIRLVLKLIADVGLVGLPNAGKSTLLSVVSAATPKIANYPFTTLEPQLGVAEVGSGQDRKTLVIADLPGIIEGASQGKGLGTTFLKHIERTRTIVLCMDSSAPVDQLLSTYTVLTKELGQWSQNLVAKPKIIALTKIDLLLPEEQQEKQRAITQTTQLPVYLISAVAHQGVQELLTACL